MSTHPQKPPHPIIVVTGANSGVGFGICQRLLVQLSQPCPPDAQPRREFSRDLLTSQPFSSPFAPTQQLTLVLACRSVERANTARRLLLELMDAEISRRKSVPDHNGHVEKFRRGLRIDCLPLDLANMDSIFEFAEDTSHRYPYISHLILNAGMLCITGFDWVTVFKQLLTEPVNAVTMPRYLVQRVAAESPDGLGLVWQSNVFGHYSLSRLLEPLLLRNPSLDSRVEWSSSLDALPEDYDPSDPQLRDTKFSYQASKYQIDLICTRLAQTSLERPISDNQTRIRHLLVHPGVCHTNMTVSVMGFFLELAKLLCFHLARVFGSENHPIQPHKGAAAAVHAGLASTTLLEDGASVGTPRKFGTKTTIWGREYVGTDPVMEWKDNAEHGASLVELCERLFTAFVQKRGDSSSPATTDSGIAFD